MAQPSLQLVGCENGRDISLDTLAAQGVRIAGRAVGILDERVHFAPTLDLERRAAEARRHKILAFIDRHIAERGRPVPDDPGAWAAPAPLADAPETAKFGQSGIRTILWATGFARSYPWLNLPVLDTSGEIIHRGGVTPEPGLYVLGLPFMRHRSSAFICGVGRDARAISELIAATHPATRRPAA